jgi:hypothetical protein
MIFFLLASIAQSFARAEHVDMLELNHHYDMRGCHIFDQMIVWRQNPATLRFEVGYWTLCDIQDKYPVRGYNGLYRAVWSDSGKRIGVFSRQFRESWTQVDPERADQRKLHVDDRIRLSSESDQKALQERSKE